MTWRQECAQIIQDAVRDLPEGMPLDERMKVVDGARPDWYHRASWPKKAWQAARRDYLVRFGYEPRTKKAAERRASAVSELPLFHD